MRHLEELIAVNRAITLHRSLRERLSRSLQERLGQVTAQPEHSMVASGLRHANARPRATSLHGGVPVERTTMHQTKLSLVGPLEPGRYLCLSPLPGLRRQSFDVGSKHGSSSRQCWRGRGKPHADGVTGRLPQDVSVPWSTEDDELDVFPEGFRPPDQSELPGRQ